jgi:hypothetical protein
VTAGWLDFWVFLENPKTGDNIMAQEFRSDSVPSGANLESGGKEREPVRIVLIGSREAVKEQMNQFYLKQMAEVDEWSALLSAPNPLVLTPNWGDVMTILTRWHKGMR